MVDAACNDKAFATVLDVQQVMQLHTMRPNGILRLSNCAVAYIEINVSFYRMVKYTRMMNLPLKLEEPERHFHVCVGVVRVFVSVCVCVSLYDGDSSAVLNTSTISVGYSRM